MTRQTGDKTFGSVRVLCTQLAPMKALEWLPEVTLVTGPLLARGMSIKGLSEGGDLTLEDALKFLPMVPELANALSGGRLSRLAPVLLSNSIAIVNGERKYELSGGPQIIDQAFAEEVPKLLRAAWFALGVTYADFFLEFVPGAAKLLGRAS